MISLTFVACGETVAVDPEPDVGEGAQDTGTDAGEQPDVEADTDTGTDSDADVGELPPECDLVFELPEGESYGLRITSFSKPEAVAGLVSGQLGSVPPLLLFLDGLTDGAADDPMFLVGGIGERISFGFDDTPNTADDIYAMHHGSVSALTCDFMVKLTGASNLLEVTASAETIFLALGGFSSLTAGLELRVDKVELTGTFDSDLELFEDITLRGELSDEGVDHLLEAVQDLIPLSRDQVMRLLDPNNTGIIPVELGLTGRKVIVDGFTVPSSNERPPERVEEECCPQGAQIGDPIYPYLTWEDQGIQDDELVLFQLALAGLREDTNVTMIATAQKDPETDEILYYVYSGGAIAAGSIVYRRVAGEDGGPQTYEIVSQTGDNPLGNVDPMLLANYEDFLDAGSNPNNITYEPQGYALGDGRLSFVPVEDMNYPFAYERIAQNFDDPRTGDLMILSASYAQGGFGTHGHLNSLQSRSPLFISGPGVRNSASAPQAGATVQPLLDGPEALILEDVAKVVDIAPTLAAALGLAKTRGVGPDGRLRDDVYLKWQDGRVLEEIFTEEALEKIRDGEPVAERAIIIVNDGLTNIEILFQALSHDPQFNIDAYHYLLGRGLAYRYGSITNFPSNTYPSHNTLGSGAWAGHHGIIDNTFWNRAQALQSSPIREIFETEYMMGSAHPNLPVETLHEAVVRTFGDLSQGNLTASINEPSTRGAEFATLEKRFPQGFSLPSTADSVTIGEDNYVLPPADLSDYAGVMDNGSLQTFAEAFLHHRHNPETGIPVPRYTIVNFGSTDSAGHAHGPHGDQERNVVISRVNDRLNILFGVLHYLDLMDTTLIVLTSDHGMELQDSSRMGNTTQALNTAGIKFRRVGGFIYLRQLQATILDNELAAGATRSLTLNVFDSDTRWGAETKGVEGVRVSVVSGGTSTPAATDADGNVTIEITLEEGVEDVMLEFEGNDWNHYRLQVAVAS